MVNDPRLPWKVKTAMRIGMDFGTTNSGIAVYDGVQVRVLKLDPVAASSVMRSVIYLTRDHELHVGQAAIDLYNAQNINRERRMVRKRVGRVEMTFAEVGNVATDVHVFVDELEPGRLMRSLKSALATPYTGTAIYGRDYTLEALVALYLRATRERASALLETDVTEVVLGRPVHFVSAESAEDDQRAEDRLYKAARLAGFTDVAFEFEPVAAAKHYAQSVGKPQNILVFDFGGGTLDLTVMRVAPGKPADILAIGGVGIAGDRFDQRIVEQLLLPHFGKGVTWGDKSLPVPRHLIEQITVWEGLSTLATVENRSFLHRMQTQCTAPARLFALESLIFNFYGFALFETVETVKRQLSGMPFDTIRFVGQDIDVWQPVTRSQFESIIRSEWRRIRDAAVDVVQRSGVKPEQIDAVVRTGGSSSIPIFLDMLGELFGADKLATEDLFTGVTAGLGICAWEHH
ncbi:MAG: Hsp70 family protein [Anaerolineae bacterium]|nr:Hsp70 family protein [Anaerolineae bacterium]